MSSGINSREFYCSANGDKWFLRHDCEGERVYVKHIANPAAGGHQTDYEVHAFLNGPQATGENCFASSYWRARR